MKEENDRKTVMRDSGPGTVRNLQSAAIGVCACLAAALVVQQDALTGLGLAIAGGIIMGFWLWS